MELGYVVLHESDDAILARESTMLLIFLDTKVKIQLSNFGAKQRMSLRIQQITNGESFFHQHRLSITSLLLDSIIICWHHAETASSIANLIVKDSPTNKEANTPSVETANIRSAVEERPIKPKPPEVVLDFKLQSQFTLITSDIGGIHTR